MRRIQVIFAAVLLALVLFLSVLGTAGLSAAQAGPTPSGFFIAEPFVPTITFPADITFAPDGLLYVAERFVGDDLPITGTIRIVHPEGTLQDPPFAVVELADGSPVNEKGLLGLAIDPDYPANHYVYAYYTARPDDNNPINHGELVRYTAVLSAGNWIGTDKTILVDDLPASTSCCHNGGALGFGPDGKLYLSIGDNLDSGNGQNLSTLAATIQRYNKDGSIPPDNPFTQTVGAEPAIYAYGIRNSFGFDWHPLTGEMFATENGPNCNDELNHIIPGGNYGWAVVSCGPNVEPYIAPIWIVDPPEGLTGAAFYTPSFSLDPLLYVTNWRHDEIHGRLYQVELNDQNTVDEVTLQLENCGQPDDTIWNGLALAVSPAGDLYLSCQRELFPAPPDTGSIFRIVYAQEITPTAAFTASTVTPVAGREVQFTNLSAGTNLSFTWDFGDGTPVSTATHPAHIYAAPGAYTVTLTATNVLGSDSAELLLTVSAKISLPVMIHEP